MAKIYIIYIYIKDKKRYPQLHSWGHKQNKSINKTITYESKLPTAADKHSYFSSKKLYNFKTKLEATASIKRLVKIYVHAKVGILDPNGKDIKKSPCMRIAADMGKRSLDT